jgi:hypothetical protein
VGFPFRESERRIVTASGVTRRNVTEGRERTNKKPRHSVNGRGLANFLAEAVRFELTDSFPSPVFKTGALNRSATLPHEAAL